MAPLAVTLVRIQPWNLHELSAVGRMVSGVTALFSGEFGATEGRTTPGGEADVYAWGLCYASVCGTTVEAAEREVNLTHPTGLDHGWKLADEPFRDGTPNGGACSQAPNRRHWLFVC